MIYRQIFIQGWEKYLRCFLKKRFTFISDMNVADLLQAPPVRENLVFSGFFGEEGMKHLLGI